MSKTMKIILIVGIIVIIVVGVSIAVIVMNNGNNLEKIASQEFGDEYCDAVLHISTRDLVPHNCKICGKEFQDSSMREDICDECAEKTDRCNFCGKKLTAEIKEQRAATMNGIDMNVIENQ